jgi:hypothetical protein
MVRRNLTAERWKFVSFKYAFHNLNWNLIFQTECYSSSRLCVVALTRWDAILPSLGMSRGGIASPAIISPLCPVAHFGLILVIYCQPKSDVMNLLHFADVLWLNTASGRDQICIIIRSFKFQVHGRNLENKFKFHNFQLHLWNLIEYLAIPLCINILIWNYKLCCETPRFVGRTSDTSCWLWLTKNSPRIRNRVLGLPCK